MTRKIEVEESSGNVFADLGLPDPEERLAKALLSRAITNAVKQRGLTQAEAARILGTTQPKVSDLVRGNLGSFTMDRLFRYLTRAEHGHPHRGDTGRLERAARPRAGGLLKGAASHPDDGVGPDP